MSDYYDLVLGIIPLTFIGVLGVGSVVGVAMPTAGTVASLIAAGFMIHAMFINPPVGPGPGERSTSPTPSPSNQSVDPAD